MSSKNTTRRSAMATAGSNLIGETRPRRTQNLVHLSKGDCKISIPVKGTQKPWTERTTQTDKGDLTVVYNKDGSGADIFLNTTRTVRTSKKIGHYGGDTKGLNPSDIAQAVGSNYLSSQPDALDMLMGNVSKKPTINTSAITIEGSKKPAVMNAWD